MSTEDNVIRPPFPASEQVTQENAHAASGWKCSASAAWHQTNGVSGSSGAPPNFLRSSPTTSKMIEAELKERVKKAQAEAAERRAIEKRGERQHRDERDQKRDQRRDERDQRQIEKEAARKAEKQARALAQIAKLPVDQHEAKLFRTGQAARRRA